MNNNLQISKILYKNISSSQKNITHDDFSCTASVNINNENLSSLGKILPIYFNISDKKIYLGTHLESSKITCSQPISYELTLQTDYILSAPINLYAQHSEQKHAERIIIASMQPSVTNSIIQQLQKNQRKFINKPQMHSSLARLGFTNKKAQSLIINYFHNAYESFFDLNDNKNLTLFDSTDLYYVKDISEILCATHTYYIVDTLKNWATENIAPSQLKAINTNKIINSYSRMLSKINSHQKTGACTVINREKVSQLTLDESLKLVITPYKKPETPASDEAQETLSRLEMESVNLNIRLD